MSPIAPLRVSAAVLLTPMLLAAARVTPADAPDAVVLACVTTPALLMPVPEMISGSAIVMPLMFRLAPLATMVPAVAAPRGLTPATVSTPALRKIVPV